MTPSLAAGPERERAEGIDGEPHDPDSAHASVASAWPEDDFPSASVAAPAGKADGAAPAPTFDGVDVRLLEQLRAKDEQAFAAFVGMHHRAMVRFAMQFVRSQASAEEVTQDTWLAALDGIDRFEGRSSIVSWIYAILINKAKSRGRRDSRDSTVVPDAGPAIGDASGDASGETAEAGGRARPDHAWNEIDPERILAGREIRTIIDQLIDELPEPQRTVMTMQDLQGLDAESVRSALGLTEGNRRVLLHRARARVRKKLRAILDLNAEERESSGGP